LKTALHGRRIKTKTACRNGHVIWAVCFGVDLREQRKSHIEPGCSHGAVQRGFAKIGITRNGLQPSTKGPGEYFTGIVRIDPLFNANGALRASGASVTFEPGACTAWHAHPFGQILI